MQSFTAAPGGLGLSGAFVVLMSCYFAAGVKTGLRGCIQCWWANYPTAGAAAGSGVAGTDFLLSTLLIMMWSQGAFFVHLCLLPLPTALCLNVECKLNLPSLNSSSCCSP